MKKQKPKQTNRKGWGRGGEREREGEGKKSEGRDQCRNLKILQKQKQILRNIAVKQKQDTDLKKRNTWRIKRVLKSFKKGNL